MTQLSILVVSRTPELLSQLLCSLDQAWTGAAEAVEVLCSWNGSAADEEKIQTGRLPFAIVQRTPYHFAANMNGLARLAKGEVLIFANDDLIADPASADAAVARLNSQPNVGIVGAQLRTSQGELAHVGISFTADGSPYHRLQYFASSDHPSCGKECGIAAVTGAYIAMRRLDFLKLEFSEDVKVCGEDVMLCLDCRRNLGLSILYCPTMSGIHDAESTRRHTPGQEGQDDDMQAMRLHYRNTRQRAEREELLVELAAAQDEADCLRGRCRELMAQLQPSLDELTALRSSIAELEAALASTRQQQLLQRAQDQATITRLELEQAILNRELGRHQTRGLKDQPAALREHV